MGLSKEEIRELGSVMGPIIADAMKSITGGDELTADQRAASALNDIRGEGKAERMRWEKLVPCRSTQTGATFLAVIQGAKAVLADGFNVKKNIPLDPDGFVVEMRDYQHCEKCWIHVRDGGFVPDGMDMVDVHKGGAEADQYKQWKYERYKLDARTYIRDNADERKRLPKGVALDDQDHAEKVEAQAASLADENAALKARLAELEAKGGNKRASP